MLNEKLDVKSTHWNFKRLIFDDNTQRQLKAIGVATLDHENYDEKGRWVEQSYHQNIEFHQHYKLNFQTPHFIQVFFSTPDHKLFFEIDLNRSKTIIDHICNADHYHGILYSACAIDQARFYLSWRIQGPRKNYRMKTFYRK